MNKGDRGDKRCSKRTGPHLRLLPREFTLLWRLALGGSESSTGGHFVSPRQSKCMRALRANKRSEQINAQSK